MNEIIYYKTIERMVSALYYDQFVLMLIVLLCLLMMIAIFLYHAIRHGNLIECIRGKNEIRKKN